MPASWQSDIVDGNTRAHRTSSSASTGVELITTVQIDKRQRQQGSTDDIAEEAGDDALPDVLADAEVSLPCHERSIDQKHICHYMFEASCNKDEDGEPTGNDFGNDILGKRGLKDRDADEHVTPDRSEPEFAEVDSGNLGVCTGGGTFTHSGSVDLGKVNQKGSVQERTDEVTDERNRPSIEEPPVRNLSLDGGHDEDSHFTSDEVGLQEDDHAQTDGKHSTLHDFEKTRSIGGEPWVG